jgi:hypothetical protein
MDLPDDRALASVTGDARQHREQQHRIGRQVGKRKARRLEPAQSRARHALAGLVDHRGRRVEAGKVSVAVVGEDPQHAPVAATVVDDAGGRCQQVPQAIQVDRVQERLGRPDAVPVIDLVVEISNHDWFAVHGLRFQRLRRAEPRGRATACPEVQTLSLTASIPRPAYRSAAGSTRRSRRLQIELHRRALARNLDRPADAS